MTDAEAETMADRLLRDAHALGKAAGCYTERQYERHKAADTDPLDETRVRSQSDAELGGIFWHSIHNSLRTHHCPPRAIRCFHLWTQQYCFTQIAAMPDVDACRQTVAADVRQALDILRTQGDLGLWEVLAEVFYLRIAAIKEMCR